MLAIIELRDQSLVYNIQFYNDLPQAPDIFRKIAVFPKSPCHKLFCKLSVVKNIAKIKGKL